MELVAAQREQIARIMELIDQAKAFLRANGVDQWQSGYPDRACIERDVESGRGYLAMLDGAVAGYLCIDFGGEPAYEALDGRWLSDLPYVVMHRLALDGTVRGRGMADAVFRGVEAVARARGVRSFRVDTDEDNRIMKRVLARNGFQYCGVVCFDNSEKIAYEKLI